MNALKGLNAEDCFSVRSQCDHTNYGPHNADPHDIKSFDSKGQWFIGSECQISVSMPTENKPKIRIFQYTESSWAVWWKSFIVSAGSTSLVSSGALSEHFRLKLWECHMNCMLRDLKKFWVSASVSIVSILEPKVGACILVSSTHLRIDSMLFRRRRKFRNISKFWSKTQVSSGILVQDIRTVIQFKTVCSMNGKYHLLNGRQH